MNYHPVVISCDSHAMEPPDLWVTRIDRAFRDRAPRIVSEDVGDWWYFGDVKAVPCHVTAKPGYRYQGGGTPTGARLADTPVGGHDPDARLDELERDGVFGEVLYPTIGMYAFRWIPDSSLVNAMCRAYNDWLAEFCSAHPDRFKGGAMINVDDIDVAVLEVERASSSGLSFAVLSVDPGEGLGYAHPRYEPLWAALEVTLMPIGFHLLTNRGGHTSPTGQFATFSTPGDQVSQSYHAERTIADMTLSGVFARHPSLNVVAAEYEAGWAAFFVYNMDLKYRFHVLQRRKQGWSMFPDGVLPSDFFRQNVYVTWQEDCLAIELRDRIGSDRLLWGSDYPHGSGTFPRSQEILKGALVGVPDAEAAQLVGTNAARLYGFDI